MTRNRRGWGHIRRLPSKRYQASYVGPDVRRHTAATTFTLRSDAEGWLANERRMIERGEWTPPASRVAAAKAVLTFRDYSTAWVGQRALKPRARGHYADLLTHINPTLGDVELATLTPQAIRSWYAVTLTDKPTYRAHAYALLHAILGTAVSDGSLTSNPAMIEKAMTTHRRREPVILTVGEVGQLADIIDERFKALILVSAWCGLRFGEVAVLRRKDVGADAEIITVARGVTHGGGCHISTPKSGKGRSVVVPPHVRGDLLHHLDTFVGTDREALLFAPVQGGCHLTGNSFRPRFNAALAKIGRSGVRIHDLRHFAGTQVARVGILRESMDRLGHSTVRASLMYQGLVSGREPSRV